MLLSHSNGNRWIEISNQCRRYILVFIAIMALCNGILDWIGGWTQLNEQIASNTYDKLSFEFYWAI